MRYFIKEDDIERELIDVCLKELHYDNHFNCLTTDHLGRESETEVLNLAVLRREISRINQSETDRPGGLSDDEVEAAVNALKEIDFNSDPKATNTRILSRIISGYKVNVLQANGKREPRTLQYIKWDDEPSNQFDVVNQLWIQGAVYRLRPDVIIYVNGIPLVTIELKDSNIPVREAYKDNLTRYKGAIPQIMAYNAFLVASNALHTLVGSTYADWAFFAPWFRNSEDDKQTKQEIENEKISLDVMARSLLRKENLLNYVRNFILFYNGTKKIYAINHDLMTMDKGSNQYQNTLKIREWMCSTDMAVVISVAQGDEEKFAAEGLTLKPHIDRMNDVNEEGQELQDLFRDEYNPLRIVFVCSMWLTGFDSPMVSTLYVDKPLSGQNLMQTIARPNRRCSVPDALGREKTCGQIIAYCNIFGSLKRAFAIYGNGFGDDEKEEEDSETSEKSTSDNTSAAMTLDELYTKLRETISRCVNWCKDFDVDLQKILDLDKAFNQISLFDQYADCLIHPIERKAQFLVYDNAITQLYDECLPDIIAKKKEFVMAEVIHYLRQVMDNSVDRTNLDSARRRIKELLNQSIVPKGSGPAETREYTIKEFGEFDLSRLDIDKLREQYGETKCKALEITDLEDFISQKLNAMLNQNSERRTFAEEFQRIIDRYNAGSIESEEAFQQLVDLLGQMTVEQRRAAEEGLTEEELEVFDILRKENLSKADEVKVKAAARDLLEKLKASEEQLCTAEWYKDSSKKSSFVLFVRDTLDKTLPACYDPSTFKEKNMLLCNQFIIRAANNGGYLFAG